MGTKAKIIIDGFEIECEEGTNVLQVALEAGWDVPHYCYHPSLKVVASCRLCLMEIKSPDPKTQEMVWSPKLIPSCQTPVRDGMEVRFDSPAVRDNRKRCLEFYLLDHPLDCPVCDQAGECHLQDYSERFGSAESRMVEQKHVNPKKDIGPRTLLYQDRCVMCTRCVRFTKEVAGTGELSVVNRGSKNEIDVFPGVPLNNPMQGNVVDICPVGSLLDKDFLFKQRVWRLKSTPSVCPGCSTGCTINVDHNEGVVYRVKPRMNPKVNDWWICDKGRFGWKEAQGQSRIDRPMVRGDSASGSRSWESVLGVVREKFEGYVKKSSDEKVALVLSPFMACEEAWLLINFIRDVAPMAALVAGPIPTVGDDLHFPVGADAASAKFTISSEHCPNRKGIELLIAAAGGRSLSFDDFKSEARSGKIGAAWIVGGYPGEWIDENLSGATAKLDLLVVQDLFRSVLVDQATVVLPSCLWAEREGCFVNRTGLVQPFGRAVDPPDGARYDGQYLFELAGFTGLYSGERVRELMADSMPVFAEVYEPPAKPKHAH